MSDDEREIDNDLDSENEDEGSGNLTGTDKRAHHNALERKRRDHIKDSFNGLKDAIPTLQVTKDSFENFESNKIKCQGDKSSRAQILKKASEYIAFMRRKNGSHSSDIEDLRKQNSHLENQIRALEKAKSSGNFSSLSQTEYDRDEDEDALEDEEQGQGEPQMKKVKL
jgi:Max protein